MEHIGIDVHKNQSQICILTPEGELIEKRICTERGRFAAFLGDRAPSRVVIEAATESEWVARCVESLGHEVIVADPNFAPMYARRSRKVKTDRRDARALAEACRLGAYRPAHRASDEQRHVRARHGKRWSAHERSLFASCGRCCEGRGCGSAAAARRRLSSGLRSSSYPSTYGSRSSRCSS